MLMLLLRRKVKGLERYIPREERENRDWKDMFDLIRGMLELDPAKRITLPQAMNHVFLERIALSRKASRNGNNELKIGQFKNKVISLGLV